MNSLVLLFLLLFGVHGDPNSPTKTAEEVVLQMQIDAGRIECLYQTITDPKHVALELDYQVTMGGETDITFSVKNPKNIQIVYDFKRREGTHRVEIKDPSNGPGDYAFCFDNSFSSMAKKNVFFEFFLLDKDGNFLNNYDAFTTNDLLTPIMGFERITTKVKANMNEIERIQVQLRAIESRDRSLMEANFERVNFWSSIHLGMILFILGLQLYTIRSLFIDNSTFGRLIRKGRLND